MSFDRDGHAWAIETVGLTKTYGRVEAVSRLNLQVRRGNLFGFIGPNGAGKTTTLRMIAGLLEPTRGEVHLGGEIVTTDGWVHRRIGYMPDFFGVYDDMRVWEYLDFFGRCYGLPAGRRAAAVDDLLDLVDLGGKRNADVDDLSRGMKQRLCLAHALVHDPDVLLLDEPASGLDPRARIEMRELLVELRRLGKTVVISSHILAELAEICDAVGIMERGRLVASGSLDDIQRAFHPTQIVRLRVLSAVDRARAAISAVPLATLVEAEAPATEGPAWIPVALEGDEGDRAAFLRQIMDAGVEIAACVPVERDLEGVFLRVTRGEAT